MVASKIYILSYDERDESNHISNLINIFGKTEFDLMRREKDITFMSINDELTSFMAADSEIEELKQMAHV